MGVHNFILTDTNKYVYSTSIKDIIYDYTYQLLPYCIEYYENGNIQSFNWFIEYDKKLISNKIVYMYFDSKQGYLKCTTFVSDHIHNISKITEYYYNGDIEIEKWLQNDECHREDDPAQITYFLHGGIFQKSWYLNGRYIANTYEKFKEHIYKNKEIYLYLYIKILKKESINLFD